MKRLSGISLSLMFFFSSLQGINCQVASFVNGIKNDWSFFTDRIIYSNNSGIFYRLNADTNLYYSNGTIAGSKATGYTFGTDVFFDPDLAVFTHTEKFTALGTNKADHDIIIFKDKSSNFEYVENKIGAFNGMTFHNGKLYYLYGKSGSNSNKLVEYDPETKTKKEIFTFDSNGAFGISIFKDKLLVIGYKNGNSLLSIDPATGIFTTIYKFNSSNTFARSVNMQVTEDNLYFWYPNGNSDYSLYVTKGVENSTIALLDDLERYDPFPYYADNIIESGGGNLIFRTRDKNNFNNNFAIFSNGTKEGTIQLKYKSVNDFSPYDFEYFCGRFFFMALDEFEEFKLFSTDGSLTGTKKMSDTKIHGLKKFNNKIYLNAGNTPELYAWNEKSEEISFVLDVNGQARESNPREFAATQDKLFMVVIKSNLDLSYNLAYMTEPFRAEEECKPSSIFEKNAVEFSIFPNPFNSNFSVTADNLNGSNYTLTTTDLVGKIISTIKDIALPYEMNTSDWTKGMYIIEISKNSQASKSIKVIKN